MIALRAYKNSEFERAVEIREIRGDDSRKRWRDRMSRSGAWDDHYFHLAITDDDVLVGDLQVRHCGQAMPDGVLELGLELAPECRGKGIGTQVLKLAAERFFADGAHRISGSTEIENVAMIRAFEKAGWAKEGILRGLFNDNGNLIDYVSFSIIKE
jgi:RimJ/RimL family protein N-acetyltransferase